MSQLEPPEDRMITQKKFFFNKIFFLILTADFLPDVIVLIVWASFFLRGGS
jgi:hypothetical protein